MIFDVKMGKNFRIRARFVEDGDIHKIPLAMTYLSVVYRYSVFISLTIAAINDLDVLVCGIYNAYLTAECREREWVAAGPDFGSEAGKTCWR